MTQRFALPLRARHASTDSAVALLHKLAQAARRRSGIVILVTLGCLGSACADSEPGTKPAEEAGRSGRGTDGGASGSDASRACQGSFEGGVELTAAGVYLSETFDAAVTVESVEAIEDGQLHIRLVRVPDDDADAGTDDDAGVAALEWDVTTSGLSNLPMDLVQRGEVLDLHHGATVHHFYGTSRSFILARGQQPVLFGTYHRFELRTELEAFGVTVDNGPQLCTSDGPACDFGYGTLIVTRNGQTARVPFGNTVRIADLVVGGGYSQRLQSSDSGFCDARGRFYVVGYNVK